MSVNITVGNGQGITQAIKSKLQSDGVQLKNVKLSDWQKVMDLVNQNQQQINKYNAATPNAKKDSIFTGGNDTSKIANQSNWKTDFKVNAGQTMQIDSGIFAQIKAILTGKAAKPELPAEQPKPIEDKPVKPDFDIQKTETEEKPIKLEVPNSVNKAETENTVDTLGGKIISREVNGEQRDISVATVDGQKVRREVK